MDSNVRAIFLDDGSFRRMELVDPTSAIESDFEASVLRILQRIHPSCFVSTFRPTLSHDGAGWRPDLAVIDRQLAYWFVIEVETINHSLTKHVVPQVVAFRDGEYGQEAAECIAEIAGVSVDQAHAVLKLVPRYVAVIANHNDEMWRSRLLAENIQFMGVDIFSQSGAWPSYLIHGALKAAEKSVGFGMVHSSLRVIQLKDGPFWDQASYRIADGSGTGSWTCVKDNGFAWLCKDRGLLPYRDGTYVQLLLQDDDTLLLRIP